MKFYTILLLVLFFSFETKAQIIPNPESFGNKIFDLLQQNNFEKLPTHFVNKEGIILLSQEVFKGNPEQLKQQRINEMTANWEERKIDYFQQFEKQFKRLDSNYLSQAVLDSIIFKYRIISPEGEVNLNNNDARKYQLSHNHLNTSKLTLYFHINKVKFSLDMFIVYLNAWVLVPKAIKLESSAPGW